MICCVHHFWITFAAGLAARFLIPEGLHDHPGNRIIVDDDGSCDQYHDGRHIPLFHVVRRPVKNRKGQIQTVTHPKTGVVEEVTELWAIRCPQSLSKDQWRELQDQQIEPAEGG